MAEEIKAPGVVESLKSMAKCVSEQKPIMSWDSEEIAVLFAAILKSVGKRYRFKAVSLSPQKDFHHVFVEAWSGTYDEWIPLDPIAPARISWAKECVHEPEQE